MNFPRRLFLFLLFAALFQGCAEENLRVLEEDKDAPLAFEAIEVEEARRGGEIGLRVRAKVEGYGGGSPNVYVRGRLLDGKGRAITSEVLHPSHSLVATEDSLSGAISFADSMGFASAEVAGFSRLSRLEGGALELFFPYHWWQGTPGAMEMRLELTALEGRMTKEMSEDLPLAIARAKEDSSAGRILVGFEVDYPELHSAQLWVQYLVLDTTAFNPHDSDISLFHTKSTYGFPDIFWNVGMDYQEVYRSPYFKNSVSARWDSPSDPFFMDGRDADVQLCVYDWDDSSWFNNQDDALSCWDGKLSSISQDARQPTRLKFDLVAEMGVVLLLDGVDPWAGKPSQ